ncbi:hypothetical protein EDB97_101250 [Agrobacterium tumefaciens]|nr:hypothetical protein EDB97_101250 [Agrobacterium tumefaciens]
MIRELLYELTRGFAYRSIQHPEMRKYTIWLPLLLSLILITVYLGLGLDFTWLGDKGVFSGLLTILSTLPGFYFAGLAAVATFGGIGMDTPLPKPAPQILIRVKGVYLPHPLSRRQFLSYLFSYLVILSFALCMVLLCLNALAPTVPDIVEHLSTYSHGLLAWSAAKFAVGFAILLGFASMLVTTLHGIFFLTERMHQP